MKDEKGKYLRQITLPEIGKQGQEKIKNAKVVVIGLGGLGCPICMYLTTMGIGELTLVDFDLVSESNLHRQPLYQASDVGRKKTEVAKERLEQLNPDVNIQIITQELSKSNAEEILSLGDLVIDAVDNLKTTYIINDSCVEINQTWIFGAIYKFEGQVAVFSGNQGANFRDLFPDSNSVEKSCEETGVIPTLPGVVGMIQATECIKLLIGQTPSLTNKLLLVDLLHLRMEKIEISSINLNSEKKTIPSQTEAALVLPQDQLYLDVREFDEQPRCNQPNVLQIPLSQLANRNHEIPRGERVYVYCKSGKRSAKAIDLLKENFGYNNLYNVESGITELIEMES